MTIKESVLETETIKAGSESLGEQSLQYTVTNADSIEEEGAIIEDSGAESNKYVYVYKTPSKKTIALVMVLSFVLPVIIMALAFVKVRIYPGGSFTLLTYDMSAQFMPTYASLRYIGNSDNSLFYSFSGALGNNAWANYSTYIINLGSWLSVLFPLDKLPDYLYFLVLFRIGTCGLAFSTYLFYGRKRDRERRYPLGVLILSCSYALMSFNIMYFICLNWLVIVTMLPIVLIGVERLLEGRKGLLFIVAFTYSIFNSFQLSYMMGIFLIMYIVFRMVEESRINYCIMVRFLLCCACSLGLTMPIFLPMMYATKGGRSEMNPAIGKVTYFSLWNLLKQFTSCQYDTITTGGLPYIFCGTITLALIVVFFLRIKKFVRTRILAASILVIYLISFWVVPINKIWHGFSETLAFPGRYSYTLSCFMLILAYEAIPDVVAIIKAPEVYLRFVKGIVLIVVLGESYLNAGYIMTSFNLENPYVDSFKYTRYINSVSEMMDSIPKDGGFYRVGRDYTFSRNDGMIFGYNGISYFSSFYSRQMLEFLNRMGYSQINHLVIDYGSTPVTDSLLGIKYRITQYDQGGNDYLFIDKNNDYSLYENPFSLPLGFVTKIKDNVSESSKLLAEKAAEGDAFACQELFMDDIANKECNIFEYIDYNIEEVQDDVNTRHVRISFEAPDDSQIWLYSPNSIKEDVDLDESENSEEGYSGIGTVSVNGHDVMPIRDEFSTICTYLGSFEAGECVETEISSMIDFDNPWIVKLDLGQLRNAVEIIKQNGFVISEHADGKITGFVDIADEDEMLVLTLPNIEGYEVKVDGIKTEHGAFRKAFLAIKLNPGYHYVELSFVPPGLRIGLIVCLTSVVLLLLILSVPSKTMCEVSAKL